MSMTVHVIQGYTVTPKVNDFIFKFLSAKRAVCFDFNPISCTFFVEIMHLVAFENE